MSNRIIISIVLLKFGVISANYLQADSGYLKPKLERNNVVNKGVWTRNKQSFYEKANTGDFIFRANSVDGDSILQNNFDAFGDNYIVQNSPFLSSYIERSKRSPNHIRKRRPRKSLKNCTNKSNCKKSTANSIEDKSFLVQSKIIPDLKPTSVFNDYPYEVAILLNSHKIKINDSNNDTAVVDAIEERLNFNEIVTLKSDETSTAKPDIKSSINDTQNATSILKRSSKYEGETIKKFELLETINKTEDNIERNKVDRDIFDKEDRVWQQNAALTDFNVYKVVPKEPEKNKPVTERGLIKVISMLTKTFKKIIKQHNEIKSIHSKLSGMNDDFLKNVALITRKFEDFNEKYSYLKKFNEKFENLEANFAVKEEYFRNKQREMARNFVEFETQQKKFLNQQKQFYAIQKLMLSQNEKINLKQNLIAKTQSEISHRQNNFARILKKAKELYMNSNNPAAKLYSHLAKIKNNTIDSKQVTHTTTSYPMTETVKINLFSIPVSNRIENQDESLMKEKDEQPIDDLVYKYYFNNTFIDNIMKNKILTSYVARTETREIRNSAKNKRNELNTTILLPVDKANITEYVNTNAKRDRRWISHNSRRNAKRKPHVKGQLNVISTDIKAMIQNNTQNQTEFKMKKANPFLTMATTFCNEIGQNTSKQILEWCVEKALRRLQYKGMKPFASGPVVKAEKIEKLNKIKETKQQTTEASNNNIETPSPVMTFLVPSVQEQTINMPNKLNEIKEESPQVAEVSSAAPSTLILTTKYEMKSDINQNDAMYAVPTEGAQNSIFFPDNDELESNLKQYEIKPDQEGNVYYDGSVHTSDMILGDSDGGFSDIMPGLDSNSRVDLDPVAFDLQARRRAYVKSINADILKKMFRIQA